MREDHQLSGEWLNCAGFGAEGRAVSPGSGWSGLALSHRLFQEEDAHTAIVHVPFAQLPLILRLSVVLNLVVSSCHRKYRRPCPSNDLRGNANITCLS